MGRTHTTDFNVGDTFYSKEVGSVYKNHIVAILTEEDVPMIVYKYYGKHRQWWHYEIKAVYEFNWYIRDGFYVKNKDHLKRGNR